MVAAADEGRAVKPFGFFGLCLSLVGLAVLCLLLTALFCGLAGLAAVAIMGRAPFASAFTHFLDALNGGILTSNDVSAERLLYLIFLAFYAALALAVLLAAKWRGGRAWRNLIGWRNFRPSDWLIWAIMAAALIYSATASDALGHFLQRPAAQLDIPTDRGAAAALLILAAGFAPVAEELLFRGWIYTALRLRFGLWAALLVSSALFALAHYDASHVYAMAVFPIGLALGALRERAGLKASILFHAINNFAAFWLSAVGGG